MQFPLNRFEDLSNIEILRKIDEIHNYRSWRALTPQEEDDIYTLQNQLKVNREVEKIDGFRR